MTCGLDSDQTSRDHHDSLSTLNVKSGLRDLQSSTIQHIVTSPRLSYSQEKVCHLPCCRAAARLVPYRLPSDWPLLGSFSWTTVPSQSIASLHNTPSITRRVLMRSPARCPALIYAGEHPIVCCIYMFLKLGSSPINKSQPVWSILERLSIVPAVESSLACKRNGKAVRCGPFR